MQRARQEAIRRGVDVVVLADTANDRFFAFANVDDDAGLLYQPNASAVAVRFLRASSSASASESGVSSTRSSWETFWRTE